MLKPKIVILCPYPKRGAPSQRFRFEQQIEFLRIHFDIVQLSFWTEKSNSVLYKPGNILLKFTALLYGLLRRIKHVAVASSASVVFVHREVVPIGSAFYEWVLSKFMRKKLIFDFDDAIWNLDTSASNKHMEWLKNPKKTEKIIRLSAAISAGNSYLADYAAWINDGVTIIPSTIDTDYHTPKLKSNNNKICIGWTGSNTTIRHFEMAIPLLEKLQNKYGDKIYFKLIGDSNYYCEALKLTGTEWSEATEISELQELDIGIMPLPDNQWSKGKCGFKGLQYMALEIPTIMSPVGVNSEIIKDGANGYLASTENEWIDRLSQLIESKELREKLGKAGRQTVIERYSVVSQQQRYLDMFNRVINGEN